MVTIHKLDTTNHRDVRRFVRFPFRLYRGCRQWVPPLLKGAYRQLDRENYSFYRHSDADFFLAMRKNEVVGRIAVLEPRRRNAHRGEKVALFYLFESVEDIEVAQALFSAGFDWARSRGLEYIMGPEGFVTGDGFGVLIKGFEYPPAMGIPYNYPYYDAFVRDSGFRKWADFYSARMPGTFRFPERLTKLAERVRQSRGIRVVRFNNKDELRAIAPKVLEAYNEAFEDNPRFVPVRGVDADEIVGRLIDMVRLDLLKLIAKDDEIIGFILAFPNVSRALQRCRGQLFPFGWALLMWEFNHTRWIDINGGGILPKYQGTGALVVLYDEMQRTGIEVRVDVAELVQINENNTKMVKEFESYGIAIHKIHRQYEREL